MSAQPAQKQHGRDEKGRFLPGVSASPDKVFKPGVSGNPGGVGKGTVFVAEAYKRLGSMPVEELRQAKFASATETAVQNAILRAVEAKDWKAAHEALKELADRVDGKAEQRQSIKEDRTITVIFEKPEFANHDTDTAQVASENPSRIEAVQRAGVRQTLRQITAGPIPVDRDGA